MTIFVIPGVVTLTPEYSLFGYNTILPGSSVTGSDDSNYPVENALDYRDNTEFAPASTGESVFIFDQSTIHQVDYFGICSKNARDANLSVKVEIFDVSAEDYVEVANFGDIGNSKPKVYYFGDLKEQGYFDSNRQRITITCDTQVKIFSMYLGKALLFNRTPSLGFQPPHTAPKDKVVNFTTDGNNFINGRRIPKGYQALGTINFVEFSEQIADYFEDYQQHVLNSRPMYFAWSNNQPNQVIYGLQNPETMTRPTYKTSFHCDMAFDINGFA